MARFAGRSRRSAMRLLCTKCLEIISPDTQQLNSASRLENLPAAQNEHVAATLASRAPHRSSCFETPLRRPYLRQMKKKGARHGVPHDHYSQLLR